MSDRKKLILLLLAVLAVRIAYLGLFHDRIFSGPSTQFEQAFVAMGLLEGRGVTVYREPPAVVDPANPTRLLDPGRYAIVDPERVSYIKEVPGYGFLLAGLWTITGTKTWLAVQLFQIGLEILAAWGLFGLARRFFGPRAALWTVLVFAFLFHEARASIIAYKDIILLYVMLIIAVLAARLFEGKGRAGPTFALACAATGLGFYFMPNILIYPLFLTAVLLLLRKIKIRTAVIFVLVAVVIVGAAVFPYQSYVRAHRAEPGVTPPLFWYRFWLGTQVRSFYSTEEERFQDFFSERMQATGRTLEEICKDEFLALLKAHPAAYALKTARKLLFGTVLVYGNAGDASGTTSWTRFKSDHPQSGFKDYARSNPWRILGMILGTLSASLLFPLSVAAAILLVRAGKSALALFFLHIPFYYILLHMFFHYEARYLLGTLPGYLPLIGYLFSRIAAKRTKAPAVPARDTLPA